MAQLTGSELVDEVRSYIGREGADDEGVITDTRVIRWLNEAQQHIARECPGLPDLDFDSTSLVCVSDQIDYNLVDITCGEVTTAIYACHIRDIFIVDGNDSFKMDFLMQDEFDADYIDPTSSDYTPSQPEKWTRKGNVIKLVPRCSSAYSGDIIRVEGTKYAKDFTVDTTAVSQITRADEGLVMYGAMKAYSAMGMTAKRDEWLSNYSMWLYGNPNTSDNGFRGYNNILTQWDGDILFDR